MADLSGSRSHREDSWPEERGRNGWYSAVSMESQGCKDSAGEHPKCIYVCYSRPFMELTSTLSTEIETGNRCHFIILACSVNAPH